MNDRNFTTSFTVDQTPEAAFAAINNVRGWWSEEIEGRTDKLGEAFNYRYKDVHRCTIKVTELIPEQEGRLARPGQLFQLHQGHVRVDRHQRRLRHRQKGRQDRNPPDPPGPGSRIRVLRHLFGRVEHLHQRQPAEPDRDGQGAAECRAAADRKRAGAYRLIKSSNWTSARSRPGGAPLQRTGAVMRKLIAGMKVSLDGKMEGSGGCRGLGGSVVGRLRIDAANRCMRARRRHVRRLRAVLELDPERAGQTGLDNRRGADAGRTRMGELCQADPALRAVEQARFGPLAEHALRPQPRCRRRPQAAVRQGHLSRSAARGPRRASSMPGWWMNSGSSSIRWSPAKEGRSSKRRSIAEGSNCGRSSSSRTER